MSNVQRMEAISNVKKRKYKCPFCDNRYDRVRMITHIEKKHPEYISDDYTATRIVFNLVNKKEKGTCVMCGKESPWNEEKGRYDRFCSPECVKAYTKLADRRLKDVTGKTKQELLKDPEYQNKVMLSHRSISGEYTFQDGSKKKYVGTYEKNFLRFMDVFLNIKSEDIETPGPIIDYEYKGKKHKWITDAYYAPYNLVFDIKDGGDNPNNREMPEYRAKQDAKEDAIKKLNKYNYIRLTDNKFEQLIQLMMELKELYVDNNSIYDPIIRINESSLNEACKDVETARKFVRDVGKLAKKYDANYFIVTDGASGTSNTGNPAVKHARDCHIEWEKKHGHDPYEDWSKDDKVNESTMIEDNIITEAVIFDKDDAYYNFDKFVNGQCNILFITGFSGGGKTTLTKEYSKKYKAEIIEIDNFECYMNRVKKDDGSVYSEFLYKTDFGKEYMERYMGLTDTSVNLIFQRDFTNEMMKFLLDYCGKRKNQKFIIEGMQVFRWEKYQKIKDYALIIKGTSALTSAIRRIKRNKEEMSISHILELMRWYVKDDKMMNKLHKVFNESCIINEIDNSEDNEMIGEGYLINKKDIYYNKDKFDSGEINLCFITGHSGSGKTTMGRYMQNEKNVETYGLDDLISNYNFSDDNLKEYGDLIYSFFKGVGKQFRYHSKKELYDDHKWDDTNDYNGYEFSIITSFVNYAIKYAKSHKNTKFVLEGVWIYIFFEPKYFEDYAVYIKGTSALISNLRGARRDSKDGKNKLETIKNRVRELLSNLKYRLIDEKDVSKFYNYFKSKMDKGINESSLVNNIDTIVFDIGDVLLRCDSEYIFSNYKMLNNKQKEEALSLLDKDYDEYSLEEILLYIDEHFPDLSNHKDELIDLHSQIDPYDYTYDLLNTLKDRGYKLYYLSNWSKWGIELLKMQNKLGFLDIFDGGLFSYEINMRKPDKNIYEYFIDKFDIIPDKTIFFDDKRKNIEAAKEIGMNAYEFNYEEYDYILTSHKSLQESVYSSLDVNFKPKGKKNLSSFKRVHITEYIIEKYKKEYPILRHVRCKDTKIYTCDGYMWFDNNKLVAVVGSCEYNDDNTKWIVSLEIMDEYKGYGLSKQILDYAVKIMNCKYLSVNKNNKIAKMIYDKYGFKVYEESDTMYYMTIDNNKYIRESINNSSMLTEKGSYILLKEYVEPNSLIIYDEYTYSTIDSAIRLEQLYNQNIHCYSYDRNTDTVNYLGEMNVIQENDSYTVNWIDGENSKDYITEQLINDDYNSFINEEAVYDDKHKNPIYVILLSGNNPLSYAIRKVTKSDYTHCSLSFNSKLNPFYSFGLKENLSLRDLGFTVLHPKVKEFSKGDVKFAVYTMFVSDNQRKKMIQRLKWFKEKEAFLGYDFIGLIKYVLNRSSDNNLEKWFCSRFVMEILGQGIKIGRDASLYSPQQVKDELTNISLVNKGDNFYEYDHRITDKNVNDIKSGRYNYNEE